MSAIVRGIIGVVEIVVGVITGQVWLIGLGVATLLTAAASLIDPAKKNQSGLQTQLAFDPTFPRQLIVGRTITAGSLVAQFTHDSLPLGGGNDGQNRVLELVIALADHECDALEQIIVNGQVVNLGTFDATLGNPITTSLNPITFATSYDYTNYLWVMFYSGAAGQTVDAHLHSVLGAQWPTTSVGQNVCYVRVTVVWNPALFGGIPQLQFVLRGAKLYDPRLDSTVGGSGSQVWGTTSTYTWTDNTAVIAYNICRGIYVGGSLFYGASATADEVPFAPSVAAMNACDEAVSLKAGGTENRYRSGGQVAVNSDAQSFLVSLTTTMAGYVGTGGGSICLIAGVAQTPVVSFTDDDIMAREPYDNAPKFGFDSLKNAVSATFVDPTQNWTRNTVPTRTSSSDITEDGGIQLNDNYSFDMIYSNTQAQRVMEIIRQRNRRQITQTVTLRPSALAIERGDWVQWTSVQWAYSTKSFFALGVQIKPNLDIVLNLVEIDSTIFDWTPSTDELAPAGGLLPSADPPAAAVPSGVTASPLTQLGDAGRALSSFQVVFDPPSDGTIVGFEVEYRIDGTTDSLFAVTQDVTLGLLTLPGLVPNTLYDFRYQFIGIAGRATPWSSWATFTSPLVQLVAADIPDGLLTDEMFAADLAPPIIVSSLPVSGSEGDLVVLTTNGKLYRYHSGAWTTATDGADIIANSIVAGTLAAGAVSVGTEIVNNLIVTGHLSTNAATDSLGDSTGFAGVPNDGTVTVLATIVVTVVNDYSPVIIAGFGQLQTDPPDGFGEWSIGVQRDGSGIGVPVSSPTGVADNLAAVSVVDWSALWVDYNATAGTHTYTIVTSMSDETGNTGYPSYTPIYGSRGMYTDSAEMNLINFKR